MLTFFTSRTTMLDSFQWPKENFPRKIMLVFNGLIPLFLAFCRFQNNILNRGPLWYNNPSLNPATLYNF